MPLSVAPLFTKKKTIEIRRKLKHTKATVAALEKVQVDLGDGLRFLEDCPGLSHFTKLSGGG